MDKYQLGLTDNELAVLKTILNDAADRGLVFPNIDGGNEAFITLFEKVSTDDYVTLDKEP